MASRPTEPLLDEPAQAARALPASPARRLEAATPRLTRIALALGAPAQEVPDLVQDTLLAAHRALRSFDPDRGSFDAWLATILVRRVQNARRAERRRRALRGLLGRIGAPREPRGTRDIDRAEARLVLAKLVACLSDSQREVIALYEIGDLPAEEVARALGHTAAGVRSIARDARTKLAAAAGRSLLEEGSRR